jgi:hypothetical protein
MDGYLFFPQDDNRYAQRGTLIGFRLPAVTVVVAVVDEAQTLAEVELDQVLARCRTAALEPQLQRLGVITHITQDGPGDLLSNQDEITVSVASDGVLSQSVCYRFPAPGRPSTLN